LRLLQNLELIGFVLNAWWLVQLLIDALCGNLDTNSTFKWDNDFHGAGLSTPSLPPQNCKRRSLFRKPAKSGAINPFLIDSAAVSDVASNSGSDPSKTASDRLRPDSGGRAESEVYKLINTVFSGGGAANAFTRVASESVVAVFFSWVTRLILVMLRLPPITEDVSVVFANLCDLYFTTAFRICSGNAANERILLGEDPPTEVVLGSDFLLMSPEKPPPSSPPLFGFRRRSSSGSLSGRRKPQTPKIELPATLEADICAPLRCEVASLSFTRDFLRRAQNSLQDIVILDKVDQWLEDPAGVPLASSTAGIAQDHDDTIIVKAMRNLELRLGAAWSCLIVAAILDATCTVARRKLSESALGLRFVDNLASFERYTEAVFQMLPKMVRLSSRISCARAVLGRRVVFEVRPGQHFILSINPQARISDPLKFVANRFSKLELAGKSAS
jgi:hypothetical protein